MITSLFSAIKKKFRCSVVDGSNLIIPVDIVLIRSGTILGYGTVSDSFSFDFIKINRVLMCCKHFLQERIGLPPFEGKPYAFSHTSEGNFGVNLLSALKQDFDLSTTDIITIDSSFFTKLDVKEQTKNSDSRDSLSSEEAQVWQKSKLQENS